MHLGDRIEQIRTTIENQEDLFHQRARELVAIRIVDRFGWTNLLRVVVGALWLMSIGQVITMFRSDLIHPADIGTDASNYLAAAERLIDGHPIYALLPGDRPVPLDNAPEWTVPILSPPTVATAYVPEAILPGAMAAYPGWVIGLGGTIAVGLLAIALAPPLLVFLAIQILPGLAVTAWSGNVNALLGPAIVLAWFGARSDRRAVQVIAGVAVGIAVCVKIGPILLGWWLFVNRRWVAVVGMIASGLAIAAVTLAVAGLNGFVDYVNVVGQASAHPSPLSVPGALRNAGFDPTIATLGLGMFVLAVIVAVYLLRARPVALLVAVLGTVFATSVVRYDSIGVVVVAGVAWAGRGLFLRSRTAGLGDAERPARGAVGVATATASLIGVLSVGASVATGGLVESSLSVSNQTSETVVVRFSAMGQDASFGFDIPAESTIVAWDRIGGGSPPFLTAWSSDCRYLGRVALPRDGASLTITASGPSVASAGPPPSGRPGEFTAACASNLKSQHASP